MKKKDASKKPSQASGKKMRQRAFIDLTEEEQFLWEQRDWIELTRLQMEALRSRKDLTPEQCADIEKYDALERRIAEQPEAVLDEAREKIDRGIWLMVKLIHSQKLRRRFFHADGTVINDHDSACDQFTMRMSAMIRWLTLLASRGHPDLKTSVFYTAKELTESFMRMAQAAPEDFRNAAESSLTMPSLRARNPGYTADAGFIARSIHLGEKHPAPDISDNNTRAGAMAHVLVAQILDEICRQRQWYKWEKQSLEMMQKTRVAGDTYDGVTIEEYLRKNIHPVNFEHLWACAMLPRWKDGAEAWWKGRVLPMIKDEFAKLARHPERNPALWQELGKAGETKSSTKKDRFRALQKSCRNKFLQCVKAAHEKAAHGKPAHGQGG